MTTEQTNLPVTYVPGWSDRESVGRLAYRQLGQTDMKVPLVSLGAAHVGKECKVITTSDGSVEVTGADEPIAAIREAVRLGVNLIDTSPFYGQGVSELIVGQALRTIPRQAYYISTKAGRNPDCTFDFTSASIRQSVEKSLHKLGVDYIDILQIHDVEFGNIETILSETLPALAQLRDQNKIRYIGITGYPLKVLKQIIERSEVKIDVVLSYCRHTLWDNELVSYLPYFESQRLGTINASTFGMGIYGDPIPYWHPAPAEIKQSCQQAARLTRSLGMHINRLALQHSLLESRIHTHLIGMESTEMARLNMRTIIEEYTEQERSIVQRILDEVFAKLSVNHWEDREVQRYHQDPEAFANFLRGKPEPEQNSN